MPVLPIRTKTTSKGEKRYIVRYRLGGFAFPIVHAGTFKTMKEAKIRRDLVAGELAAGRNPKIVLLAMMEQAKPTMTLARWAERFLESRIDIDENTRKNYRGILAKIGQTVPRPRPGPSRRGRRRGMDRRAGRHPETRNGAAPPGRLPSPPRVHRPRRERRPRPESEAPQAGPRGAFAAARRARPGDPRADRPQVEAALHHDRTGRPPPRRSRRSPLGRRRRREPPATAPALADEARPAPLGLPARVADRGDR